MADRAGVFQAGHRNLHAEPAAARSEAGDRRHLPRREHAPSRWCSASTSSRSSWRSIRRTPGPTTPSSSWASRISSRCARAERDQTETRNAISEFEAFVARYPNSTLLPEVKREAARGAGSAEPVGVPGRPLLLPHQLVSRRDRASPVGAQAGPRIHRPRRRLFLSRRIADQVESRGRSAPLLREAHRRIRGERASRRSPQTHHRTENTGTGKPSS